MMGRRTTILNLGGNGSGIYLYFTTKSIRLVRNASRINENGGISIKQFSSEFRGITIFKTIQYLYGFDKQLIREIRTLDIDQWMLKNSDRILNASTKDKIIDYLYKVQEIIESKQFRDSRSNCKNLDYCIWAEAHSKFCEDAIKSKKARKEVGIAFSKWLMQYGENPLGILII